MPGLTQSSLSAVSRSLAALRRNVAGQAQQHPIASAVAAIVFVTGALAALAIFRVGSPANEWDGDGPAVISVTEPADLAPPVAAAAPSARGAHAPALKTPLPAIGPDVFTDHFATIDPRLWYVHDRGPNGSWTSNDFRPGQVSVTPEGLSITLEKAPAGHPTPLTSGEISSLSTFRYGYFETRLRVPKGSGTDTGFFTYTRARPGNAGWNEIDMEFLGRNPRQVELTIHFGERSAGKVVQLPFDASQGFHSYAFDWQPAYVRWYADNAMILEVTGEPATSLIYPQALVADIWSAAGKGVASWLGPFNMLGGPAKATFACIAYAKTYEGRSLCDAPNAATR